MTSKTKDAQRLRRGTSDDAPRPVFARVTLGIALIAWCTVLMNSAVFPLFDATLPYARDISVTANAVMLLAVGAVATFRPHLLHPRSLDVWAFALLVAGALSLAAALSMPGHPVLLAVSSSVMAVGRSLATVVVGLAAASLSKRQAPLSVVMGFCASGIASLAAVWMPQWAAAGLFLALPLVAFALTFSLAQPLLELTAESEAPADVAITRPSTFLPLSSRLFVCVFLFGLVFGFALRFGEAEGLWTVGTALLRLVPALVVALAVIAQGAADVDLLLQVSVLCVATGLFLIAGGQSTLVVAGSAAVSAGSTVFHMALWTMLVLLASRNREGALASFSWGFGVQGLGTLTGAALGVTGAQAAATSWTAWMLASAVLFAGFLGFVLIGMRNASLQQTIEQVDDPASEPERARTSEDQLTTSCARIAERAGLTPREAEVFGMLARGRDRAYIEEQLVISRNTVKAHVKHVYAKLGIHSHQDLIDLVEAEEGRAGE